MDSLQPKSFSWNKFQELYNEDKLQGFFFFFLSDKTDRRNGLLLLFRRGVISNEKEIKNRKEFEDSSFRPIETNFSSQVRKFRKNEGKTGENIYVKIPLRTNSKNSLCPNLKGARSNTCYPLLLT